MLAETLRRRKVALTVVSVLVLVVVACVGLLAVALNELADPASGISAGFTKNFLEKCVVSGRHGDQQSSVEGEKDNIDDLCRCGADNLREDLAETGIDGVAHILLVEGFDAKMQRVMDECQATPSEP